LVSDRAELRLSRDVVTGFQAQTSGIQSLLRRSLIEKEGERFFLQPVVLECDRSVRSVRLGNCYPNARATQNPCLDQSPGQDYVREMQKRLIVEPIAEQLRIQSGNPQALSCS